jgi:DNA-binding response OmpR family regulator
MTEGKPRCRVLIAEDESLVSMLIEDMLLDFGTEVVGPVARVNDALRLARETDLDLAILDINLAGEATYPVADVLGARGIPFVFATGYKVDDIPDRFDGSLRLSKPFAFDTFENTLRAALAGPRLPSPSVSSLTARCGHITYEQHALAVSSSC